MSTTLAPANTETYTRLQATLRELFQLDQADLDFGIYRILNQRRAQVEAFLDTLPARVREALTSSTSSAHDELRRELSQLENTLRGAGVDPDTNPKVLELRAQLGGTASMEALENEVFSLLSNFFKRYYQQGDFISLRRYKKDVYAIPYEGEEVKLHWANHDQYYIKTGEYFKQYRFTIPGGKAVHFELREASTETANNKAAAGKERRFRLCEENFLSEDGNTLKLFFTYDAQDKKEKQEDLVKEAVAKLVPAIPAAYQAELLRKSPTKAQADRTYLEKRLTEYVAKNSFDYFIHKDLGGFLRRELDFFIKNEVLLLDDLHVDDEHKYAAQLRTVRALKAAARPVIDFLAQLEDFQKKLWLKKKFVVETNWCITLDRVPEEFYPEIADNDAQRAAWVELFKIEELPNYSTPLTTDFLKANSYLVLDTKFFAEASDKQEPLRERLLASIENLDEQTDGLLVHSENYQALQLLQERYKQQVKCIYIDPPYNTGSDGFAYKDGYSHSSWTTMFTSRLRLGRELGEPGSLTLVSLNENEFANSKQAIEGSPHFRYIGTVHIQVRHEDRILKGDKELHETIEYLELVGNDQTATPLKEELDNTDISAYDQKIDIVGKPFKTEVIGGKKVEFYDNLNLKLVPTTHHEGGVKKISITGSIREANSSGRYYTAMLEPLVSEFPSTYALVYDFGGDSLGMRLFVLPDGKKKKSGDYYQGVPVNKSDVKFKPYPDYVNMVAEFQTASEEGGVEFRNGRKPIAFVQYALAFTAAARDKTAIVLDYFAGSGSTGHAVVDLNRDGGNRKWILVEMGEYYETVTKPRMQKVVYSRKWKDGKPDGREGISQCFKTIRLESYEDVLNNLVLTSAKPELFNGSKGFNENTLLHYALDVESRESLLNVLHFADPFNYRLKITRHNELREERIDLVETFNYLIGLVVAHRAWVSGYHVVTGALLTGEKVLVIWRNTNEKDNAALEDFFKKRQYNPRDTEFDLIYVNGDNTLENLRTGTEHWKVRLIEEEFLKRMWECRDV